MTLVFLDTETTGLDPDRHEVWEIAYAVEDGPIQQSIVVHQTATADPVALRMNHYWEIDQESLPMTRDATEFEEGARFDLSGATIVASNPSFDTAFLRARWGCEPWHHRKIDIASFAMPIVGLKDGKPKGLYDIAAALDIQAPDHTAAGDVHTLRECYRELWSRFDAMTSGAAA